ncbi:MAG TPA: hypothetical protein VNJ52_11870 [Patescibacteria group bacterium]|nr:hypothetical protein [Patescibacteria group bacterium]
MIRLHVKLLGLAACLACAALPLAAQEQPRVELIHGHFLGATPPMRDYIATHHAKPNAPFRVFPLRMQGSRPGNGGGSGKSGWTDPALQTSSSLKQNYDSGAVVIDDASAVGYVPPDTNISVGNGQIVEAVNVDYAVYSTSGSQLEAPAAIHQIFAAAAEAKTGNVTANDICASVDGGDPIVLYDKIDSRWIVSQLAFSNSLNDDHECVAISQSPDATKGYYAYDFSFGNNFPDYPKLGIWADGSFSDSTSHAGVYFSANIYAHGGRFTGADMCAFPLSDVASLPKSITFVCAQNGPSVFSILPADLEGVPHGSTSPAPPGTAEYYLEFSGSSTLTLFQFTPDFSQDTAVVSNPVSITVAPFQEACGGVACVPQATVNEPLDSLGDRLMYRLSYRNYGSKSAIGQSLVVTQSVQDSSSGNQTGVRWYQLSSNYLNTAASGWGVYLQGTFGPDDGSYRWMGSIAQDRMGDLGIGYSVSSPSLFPGLAFTGRTPTDGTAVSTSSGLTYGLLEPETFDNFGAGAQKSVNRWGDYSSTSVDPSNDCTFWYANEYLKSTGSYTNWGTYIVNFQFTGCH